VGGEVENPMRGDLICLRKGIKGTYELAEKGLGDGFYLAFSCFS